MRSLAAVACACVILSLSPGCSSGSGDKPPAGGGGSNTAPVADAGPDQWTVTGWWVQLDGSGSSDPDVEPVDWAWSFTSIPAGSTAFLSSPVVPGPGFVADLDGTYVASLTVNDGTVDSLPDTVTIKAVPLNHVPDTGQTTSYTGTFGEDADYTYNAPSWSPHGDGTVTDSVTGLVWQVQDDGVARSWSDAGTYCAGLALPGTGWRLPAPYELLSITDFGRSSPAIDTSIFTGGRTAYYWSGQPFRATADAWAADFWDGGVLTLPKSTAAYVRCVRGGERRRALHDNGDGTVFDRARSLTWQQDDDGTKRTWEAALTYCEDLWIGTYGDWRLPSVKELASIEDFAAYPVAELAWFPATKEDQYWSSTTVKTATTTAWQASFLGGSVGLPGLVKADVVAYVRCVSGN